MQNMKSSFLISNSYISFLVFLKRGVRIFLFKSNLLLLKTITPTKYGDGNGKTITKNSRFSVHLTKQMQYFDS